MDLSSERVRVSVVRGEVVMGLFAAAEVRGGCPHQCISGELNDRDHENQQDDGGQHDGVVKALVTVGDGDVADATCADGSGDGRVLDHRDGIDGEPAQNRWNCLTKLGRANDLQGRTARGTRRGGDRKRDIAQTVLHQPSEEGDAGQ